MPTDTEKRTVDEIVEGALGCEEFQALAIQEVQVAADNWVDQWRDPNHSDRPIDWEVVDYHEIPREFVELADRLASFEVRL